MKSAFMLTTAAALLSSGASAQETLNRLPEAPAKQLIVTKCAGACHEAPVVLDQPRTQNDWTDVVARMRDYGAPISFAEQKQIVAYLSKNMGRASAPVKPAVTPVMANVQSTAPGSTTSSSPSVPAASNSQSASSQSSVSGSASARSAAPAVQGGSQSSVSNTTSAANAAGGASANASGGLPPGPGRELVLSKCTMCHNLDRVVGMKRTRAEWQELVTTMQEFGADVYGEDEKSVVNYLAKSFPAGN